MEDKKRCKEIEEHYKPELEEYEKKTFANNENYEKYLLAVATVFMGIWISIGKEIIVNKILLHQCWFWIAGVFFIATLASAMGAILFSNRAMRVRRKWIAKDTKALVEETDRPDEDEKKSANLMKFIPKINILSYLLSIAALISIWIFIVTNIPSINNENIVGKEDTSISTPVTSVAKPMLDKKGENDQTKPQETAHEIVPRKPFPDDQKR